MTSADGGPRALPRLATPEDFSMWMNRLKADAEDLEIFEYINPDVEKPPQPAKPEKLQLADFWIAENHYDVYTETTEPRQTRSQTPQAGTASTDLPTGSPIPSTVIAAFLAATNMTFSQERRPQSKPDVVQLAHLTRDERTTWGLAIAEYRRELDDYEKLKAKLATFRQRVIISVAQHYHSIFETESQLHGIIRSLKLHVAPSDDHARLALTEDWDRVMSAPARTYKWDKWAEQVKHLWDRGQTLDCVWAKDESYSTLKFVQAAKKYHPFFSQTTAFEISRNSLNGTTSLGLEKTIGLFRKMMRADPSAGNQPGSYYGADGDDETTNTDTLPPSFQGKTGNDKPAIQPSGCFVCYTSEQRIDPKVRKHEAKQCWLIHPSLRPAGKEPPKARQEAYDKAMKNPKLRARVEKCRAAAARGAKSSSYANVMTTDEEPVPAAYPAISSVATEADPLAACVVVDTGSPWHICNDVRRMTSLQTDNLPLKTLRGGGGECQVMAVGIMQVIPTEPLRPETKAMTFQNALFVPEWPISLISTEAVKAKGLHFETEHQNLFFRRPNGKAVPVAHASTRYGHYVLDWQAANSQSATSLAVVTRRQAQAQMQTQAQTQAKEPEIRELKIEPRTQEKEPAHEAPSQGKLVFPILHPSQKGANGEPFEAYPAMPAQMRPEAATAGDALTKPANATPRRAVKTPTPLWHERLGHPGPDTMRHLADATVGSNPTSGDCIRGTECEVCAVSKAKAVIAYGRPDTKATEPGHRLVIDWFYPGHKSDFGEKRVCLAFDEYSGKVWGHFEWPGEGDIVGYIGDILAQIQNLYGIRFRYIRLDQEGQLSWPELKQLERRLGIILEPVPTATPAQGGSYERLGGIIFKIVRCIFMATKFPFNLWPEVVWTAMLLHNILPTERLAKDGQWRSPDQAWHEFANKGLNRPIFIEKPDVSFMRALGCRAYVLNEVGKAIAKHSSISKKTRKKLPGAKLGPRAHIGYLVGYGHSLFRRHSTNIFRIWVPGLGIRALASRDVTFDEKQRYDPATDGLDLPLTAATRTYVDRLDLMSQTDVLEGIAVSNPLATLPSELLEDSEPEGVRWVQDTNDDEEIQDTIYVATETEGVDEAFAEVDGRDEEAPAEQADEAADPADYPTPPEDEDELAAAVSGCSAISLFAEAGHAQGFQRHRRDMPPPPANYKQAKCHLFWHQWQDAMAIELKQHEERQTYDEVAISESTKLPLYLMWVYDYKFDDFGYIQRFKARLVVRGDQVQGPKGDNYAFTLAARTFRLLLAISAFFGLMMYQADAVTAFLHAPLSEPVYVRHPPGHWTKGKCLKLKKALYGLPQSPKLWYATLTAALVALGLKIIPEDPCVAANSWLVVFFFVDDIVFMFRPQDKERAIRFKDTLRQRFKMKDLGPLKWFLGMRIIRDMDARRLWLVQDAYIAEVARRFGLDNDDGKRYKTPRPVGDLQEPPADYQPEASFVVLFQQKVGSLSYIACMTRPDIAEAVGQLAQFLTRPTLLLMQIANRVIRYLFQTRFLACTYGSQDAMRSAADASFGNNYDRKSTQGFIVCLFGGPILWKSIKQFTVSTSTTEAELLALAYAVKELLALERLMLQLQLVIPNGSNHILCDNLQTVRIVNETQPKVTTRLRQVDIQ